MHRADTSRWCQQSTRLHLSICALLPTWLPPQQPMELGRTSAPRALLSWVTNEKHRNTELSLHLNEKIGAKTLQKNSFQLPIDYSIKSKLPARAEHCRTLS